MAANGSCQERLFPAIEFKTRPLQRIPLSIGNLGAEFFVKQSLLTDDGGSGNGDRLFDIDGKQYTLHAGQTEIEINGETWKIDADGQLHTDDRLFHIDGQDYVVKPGQHTLTAGGNTYVIGDDGTTQELPGGLDFSGFEVALDEMENAIKTLKSLSDQIKVRMDSIGRTFAQIGESWQSPSAQSAQEVGDWFKTATRDLSDLLDDANERLRTSYQNYHDIEQMNVSNVS